MTSKKLIKSSQTKSYGLDLITAEVRMTYAEFRRKKEEAIHRNSQLIDPKQNNPEALFARGCAWKHLTKYKLAIEDFSKVININDKHAPSYYKRCLACMALGHYNQALKDANQYLELCPLEFKHLAYFNRAVCYMKMSSFENAYDDFNEAIALEPNDLFYRCCRARIAPTKLEAKHQSNQIWNQLLHPISSHSYFTRAMAFQEYDRSIQAFHSFEDAFRYDPMNIDALFQIGVYHADLNEHNQAIAIFNQLLELLPDDTRTLQYRGMSYAALGDNDKALEDFDRALKINDSALTYFERGLLYFKLGNQKINSFTETETDTQRAIKDLTEATRFDPTSSVAFLILALVSGQENLIKNGLRALNSMIYNNFDSVVDEIARQEKQLSQFKEILSDYRHIQQHQKNTDPELKRKVRAMERKFEQLKAQLDELNKVHEKAHRVCEKIEKFKEKDVRLYRFYQSLSTRMADIFSASKVIASGRVDASTSGGKLDVSATVIEVAGQILTNVMIVGSTPEQVLTIISSGLKYNDKERQMNRATRITKMCTMIDLWEVIQDMAIELTEKYDSQILEIFDKPNHTTEVTETKEKMKFRLSCCGIQDTTLAKVEPYMSEKVAEFAIYLLRNSLMAERVSIEAEIRLSTQFVNCVCIGEDLSKLSFKDSKIETTDKTKNWNMYGFFRKVGIETESGDRYRSEKVDTHRYGFRTGTKEEADNLELKLIDT